MPALWGGFEMNQIAKYRALDSLEMVELQQEPYYLLKRFFTIMGEPASYYPIMNTETSKIEWIDMDVDRFVEMKRTEK
jgi:hypothetical protein